MTDHIVDLNKKVPISVTDRPIIFSAPMVKALLAGSKTQTRRVLRATIPDRPAMDNIKRRLHGSTLRDEPYLDAYCGQPMTAANPRGASNLWCWWTRDNRAGRMFKVPFVVGDRLWVREAWRTWPEFDDDVPANISVGHLIGYPAGDEIVCTGKTRSPIHMPRWASRLTLTVTDVRVQRLQDISNLDALHEGTPETWGDWFGQAPQWAVDSINQHGDASGSHIWDNRKNTANFGLIWNQIHGPHAWGANPAVVALTFTTHHGNIDRK